ncbi:hypothetical protein BCV70DRAFT_154748 [Testicularia cyperi]|uniref:Non-structural maintenance of chromosomes element 4 n=1 Tax=Testicularia cyperi TaxID=1882483 RepID=A0A317XZF9_9BASI|nr:hypothetical protein BCV70DRAFT_154748 [Testicularia cyperi]
MARKAHDEAGPSASRGSGGATTARDNAEGSSSSRRPANGGQSNGAQDAFVYNPRQDPSDRRQVRSDYRQLIAEAEESRKDSSLKPRDLLQLIEKADSLHERVVAPSESILDTKTLSSMSEIGARMARKMKLNADAFDTNEFVTRLARYLGGEAAPVRSAGSGDDDDARQRVEDWDWAKLGRLAAGYSRRAVSIDFLLGPLEIVAKQRKQPTQRRVDDVPAERAAPQQLKQQDLQNNAENDTTAQVRKVARLLAEQGDGGVNLFRFVADPDSFTNTIENLFHVSFLVREGRASLAIDDDGNAILCELPRCLHFILPAPSLFFAQICFD